MAVVKELIRKEKDGTISFGDYSLLTKTKRSDFEYEGDMYKVKTFNEITKLEKNGLFVYESVPGTSVFGYSRDERQSAMTVEGMEDAQITLELEPEHEYKVFIDGASSGRMKTNLGGKLILSVELNPEQKVEIKVVKHE